MASAVANLQKAILDPNQPITTLLRHAQLIASKLNLPDVAGWVDLELNGYPRDGDEPPAYREFFTEHVEIRNPMRGWEFAGAMRVGLRAYQPIAELEHLSHGETLTTSIEKKLPVRDSIGSGIATNWPQRTVLSGSQFKGIIERVRNELLKWTMEMDKRGIRGEDMDFNDKEKQSAVNQVFNIQKVTGPVGNITNSTVNDYSSIQQLMIDNAVPKRERREFEDIIDELKAAPPEEKPSLLTKGEKWIVKHKELLGTIAETATKALMEAAKHAGHGH